MPAPARPQGCDWPVVFATYWASAAVALAAIAILYYPPLAALLDAIYRIENGLAGGITAALVAITLYACGRRSRSRERKFRLADMLCIEMTRLDDAAIGRAAGKRRARFRTRAGYRPPHAAKPPGGGYGERRPAADYAMRSVEGPVHAGLLSSGCLSHFEPALQARLHALYGHVERGEYDAAVPLLRPLLQEVVSFREANAPFRLQDLAQPMSSARSIPRRLRGPRAGRRGNPR